MCLLRCEQADRKDAVKSFLMDRAAPSLARTLYSSACSHRSCSGRWCLSAACGYHLEIADNVPVAVYFADKLRTMCAYSYGTVAANSYAQWILRVLPLR